MRRNELAAIESGLFTELASICREGYLGLVTGEGYPRSLAVNFAADNLTIYFHGATDGEKFSLIKAEPRVGFTMTQPLSYLPSTWSSADMACPATQLFRSVEVRGSCRVLEDPAEKAEGLQVLMAKYQPEGGFRPIEPKARGYRQALKSVAVFCIETENWTGKVKLLQNLPAVTRHRLMDRLTDRGQEIDLLTLELIRRYAPED